jgi:hypothetical protein
MSGNSEEEKGCLSPLQSMNKKPSKQAVSQGNSIYKPSKQNTLFGESQQSSGKSLGKLHLSGNSLRQFQVEWVIWKEQIFNWYSLELVKPVFNHFACSAMLASNIAHFLVHFFKEMGSKVYEVHLILSSHYFHMKLRTRHKFQNLAKKSIETSIFEVTRILMN